MDQAFDCDSRLGQSGEQIIPCVIPRRGEGGMALKASLDHTKEAALPAALAGVQAVAAGMHWLVAHSVGMSRRLCAACTWRSYPGFTPEQFTTFAHFSVSSPPPRHQIDGRPSGKVAAGQGCA